MYKIAIVEDTKSDSDLLIRCLKKYEEEADISMSITLYRNAFDFLEECHVGYDLVFLDIELPHLDGMKAAHKFREIDENATLIFVTNMAQFALKGYDVDAIDFILKPVKYPAFSMKLKKAFRNIKNSSQAVMQIKTKSGFVRIDITEIYYVEVQGHFLEFHTEKGDYSTRATMSYAVETLEPYHFLRSANSFLINPRHIDSLIDNTVLVAGTSLPISRAKKSEFLKGLSNYYGGSI